PVRHPRAAAALDAVKIEEGEDRAIRIEIEMNNSAGIFQVDELLATKLRGSGLEEHVEVVARIDAEHEKRLVPVFRIYVLQVCNSGAPCVPLQRRVRTTHMFRRGTAVSVCLTAL